MIYVFLANGFEIIEALAPVDMLQRAKLDVKTVGVGSKTVKSSGGIEVTADLSVSEITKDNLDMIILPGGMPGTLNLEADETVQKYIDYCVEKGIYIASLNNRKATVFPSFADDLKNAVYTGNAVETDDKFITARGAGVCVDFGLKCVEVLTDKAEAQRIRSQIQSI